MDVIVARGLSNEQLGSLSFARGAAKGLEQTSGRETIDGVNVSQRVVAFTIRMTTTVSEVGNKVASK